MINVKQKPLRVSLIWFFGSILWGVSYLKNKDGLTALICAMYPKEQAAKVQMWQDTLAKMQANQEDFAIEEDIIFFLLHAWLKRGNNGRAVDASVLFNELSMIAKDMGMFLTYKNPRSIARRLASIKTTLETRFGIKLSERKGPGNIKIRTFHKDGLELDDGMGEQVL